MRKLMLKFADGMLSKEQMKKVRGGCGGGGCAAGACLGSSSDCGTGCTSCSSSNPKVYGTCS